MLALNTSQLRDVVSRTACDTKMKYAIIDWLVNKWGVNVPASPSLRAHIGRIAGVVRAICAWQLFRDGVLVAMMVSLVQIWFSERYDLVGCCVLRAGKKHLITGYQHGKLINSHVSIIASLVVLELSKKKINIF